MNGRNNVMLEDDGSDQIYRALITGRLSGEDLSARKLGSFLGRTTGAVYHRWGSLDGLLFVVSQRGFAELGKRVSLIWEETRDLAECAAAYVEFGLDQPALYVLMFEHRFDWTSLRRTGVFDRVTPGSQLLAGVVCVLEESGSATAVADTRLLMAGLHGVVSFAASGRMNTGELTATDRSVALASARDLALRLGPTPARPQRKTQPKSPKETAKPSRTKTPPPKNRARR